jgi:hypothetical protein
MGDGLIFLKNQPISLIKALQMNLISAESILLDSTFKNVCKDRMGHHYSTLFIACSPQNVRITGNIGQNVCTCG